MSSPIDPPSLFERALSWSHFVLSAALVATALDLSVRRPVLGLVLAELALVLFIPRVIQRRKLRRVLRSGNVDAVLAAWESSASRVPHPETMAPLIAATAFAAHGLAERARRALSLARRGPVWDAAIEQRLVVETLLSVFDGNPEHAVETAESLEGLPLPPSFLLRGRVAKLRAAMGAFARAFAHRASSEDRGTLISAAKDNPLVYWAMRYAAAVVCIDRGEPTEAARLLEDAPAWPEESAFAAFHQEIALRAVSG
ncbi:MAG TPA: hypothetical protein VHE30_00205 [Polyangiaceae bacterium]|nr:hypothetical protein [Polyangiaceae bacterium]